MKFSKTKLMLFHRVWYSGDRLIGLTPDGKLMRFYPGGTTDDACYGNTRGWRGNYYSQFPSAKGAYKAMRRFEKRYNYHAAEYIGAI